MWTAKQFSDHLTPLYNRYKTENSWVTWWTTPVKDILNSWRLYRAAYESSLGFLLLGDTKIRKDPALVFSMGLTSAGGVDPRDLQFVQDVNDQRALVPQAQRIADVVGAGSILSDKNWTPMLNDAFILGGMHRAQHFHFAEEEAVAYVGYNPPEKPSAFNKARAAFGTRVKPQPTGKVVYNAWKKYFKENPTQFWGDWGPRVFAREVLGLKAFGYHPVFKENALVFTTPNATADSRASFRTYLDALRRTNFQVPDKQAILTAITEFLFFDETGNLWE